MTIDPIRLSMLQKQLDHISRQMGWVMMRTARSPIFSQSHDFSCFLTDRSGCVIAQADGIPVHTGGGGFAVRALLARFGADIHDGDVFLLNDPHVAGGNHLPDWTIIRPVFLEGQCLGFTCNRGHQSDIGGGAAGTYNPQATEIFHEGVRIPPIRLVEKGEMLRDIKDLLLLNTRTPELQEGDLSAMIGSTRIGAERLTAIAKTIGLEGYQAMLDQLMDYSERRLREAISQLPDGEYAGEDWSDTDCFVEGVTKVKVSMVVRGDELHFDFTGTDEQTQGFKNSPLANTYSSVYLAISSFFDVSIPRNEGTYRCVHIHAPEGTIVNAQSPAAVTMCTVFPAQDIINACWIALGKADPQRACAGWGRNTICTTSGLREDGRPFVMYHWIGSPGTGAVAERDGFNTMGQMTTLGGMMLPNTETYEQIYPVHIHKVEFRQNSAGAGRMRGGSGVEYHATIKVKGEYSYRGEGARRPTGLGISGGRDGGGGAMFVASVGGERQAAPQYGVRRQGPSEIWITSPAGGGFGDPIERDPKAVARDVEDEIISPDHAFEVYGVVVDEAFRLDLEATQDKRNTILRERRQAAK